MSYHVVSLVETRRLGSPARKAVMMYCAHRANDDGTSVWSSKATIAAACEITRRTVITVMQDFVTEGLIRPSGRRACRGGSTIEYDIDLGAIRRLPEVQTGNAFTGEVSSPVNSVHTGSELSSPPVVNSVHPSSELSSPKPSFKHPMKLPLNDQGACAREFAALWSAYPRKVGKGAAEKAWAKARCLAPAAVIAAGLAAFCEATRGTETRFVPHLATWLNQRRWEDDPEHAANRGRSSTEDLRGLATISAADDLARLMPPKLKVIG